MRLGKYAVVFFLLALAFVGVGLVLVSVSLLLGNLFGYTALSFLLMALGYAGLGAGVINKQASGRIPWYAWVWLGPYLLLTRLTWSLARWLQRGPAFGVVLPRLYLGRRLTEAEARQAVALGWVGVLDLTAEFSEVASLRSLPRYRALPVLDGMAPTPGELREAVAWLTEVTALGPVYVHCAEGHGRTGTVVLAYLLASGAISTVAEGLERLRAVRPGLRLNSDQRRTLAVWQGLMSRGPGLSPPPPEKG